MSKDHFLIVNLSGHGDRDLKQVAKMMGEEFQKI
jgi:tryptophan synthase beta subunit